MLALLGCSEDAEPEGPPPPAQTVPPPEGPPGAGLPPCPSGPRDRPLRQPARDPARPAFPRHGDQARAQAVPYDEVETGGPALDRAGHLVRQPRKTGVEPLVSFYRSSRDEDAAARRVKEYRRHFRRFRERYPWVRLFSTWNEANFAAAQPTGRDPAAHRPLLPRCAAECAAGAARSSRPTSARTAAPSRRAGCGSSSAGWAGPSHLGPRVLPGREPPRRLPHAPVPASDRGPGLGGRGGRDPLLRARAAAVDPAPDPRDALPDDRLPARVAAPERMYVYHWRAAAGDTLFDSGLLSADGVPRPAYRIFTSAIHKSGAISVVPQGPATPAGGRVRAFSQMRLRHTTHTLPSGRDPGRPGLGAGAARRSPSPTTTTCTLLDKRFQATGIKRVRKHRALRRCGQRRAPACRARRLVRHREGTGHRAARVLLPLPSRQEAAADGGRLPQALPRLPRAVPLGPHFSTFNEANFPAAQPTGNFPKRTAQFYRVARKECSGGRCLVLTNDFRADGSEALRPVAEDLQAPHGARPAHLGPCLPPRHQPLHSIKRTREFLRSTRGNVWAVEVGAVNFFGRACGPTSTARPRRCDS